jgi:spermidine synthase
VSESRARTQTPAEAAPSPTGTLPVVALFLVSGAAGLLYEVLWSRQLAHVLGGSYTAAVAVVATFLGGLALGASLGARWAERTARPLRLYALLEAGIGLYAIAFPGLLSAAGPLHGWCYRAFAGNPVLHPTSNIAVAAALLLPPTVAMGATLPVLLRFCVRGGRGVLGGTGLLYGINTLGAAGGAVLTGFWLLPSFGLGATLLVGAGLNLGVAAVAFLLDREIPVEERVEVTAVPVSRVLLLAAAGSGFAAMLFQVGWTRALVLYLGSSVHAFTLIVAAFILGLGVGGLLAPLLRRFGDRALAAMLLLAGVGGLLSVRTLAGLPAEVVDTIVLIAGDYGSILRFEAGTALRIVLLPTLCMGAAFPLLVAAVAGPGGASRAAGRVYAWNTFGAILGCLVGGMVLVPLLGLRGALLFAVGMEVVLAAAVLRHWWPLGALALLLLAPAWPPEAMTSGPYMYWGNYAEAAKAQSKTPARVFRDTGWNRLFFREGRSSTVGVVRSPQGHLYLSINGKTDASTGPDMETQVLLGRIPTLAHPAPRSAMVVGMASGVSARAVSDLGVERLDVLEISPEVLEASRVFDGFNGGVARRPGVRVLLEDGRKHMEHARETYDVIASEPTNPWIAGVSNLFTVEYFRACRERLSPGGVLGVWLQSYSIREEDFRMVVRTVRSVFPGATLWELSPYQDYLLLAPREEGTDLVAGLVARGRADLLGLLFAGREGTARIAGTGPLHTDDRLQLEFATPRCLYGDPGFSPVGRVALEGMRDLPEDLLVLAGSGRAAAEKAIEARAAARRGYVAMDSGDDPAARRRRVDGILADEPAFRRLTARMPPGLRDGMVKARKAGREALEASVLPILWTDAILDLEASLAAAPEDGFTRELLSRCLQFRAEFLVDHGLFGDAKDDFLRASAVDPLNAAPVFRVAFCLYVGAGGDAQSPYLKECAEFLAKCLAIHPENEDALTLRGVVHALLQEDTKAEAAFRRALEVRPDSVLAMAKFARFRLDQGRVEEARALLRAALALEPNHPELLALRKPAGIEGGE